MNTANTLLVVAIIVFSTFMVLWETDTIKDKIDGATIAGITVPAVHCQEDEVISWTGPDALGCVHFEHVK